MTTMHTSGRRVRMSTLDYLITIADSSNAPMDFTIGLQFGRQLDDEALRRGAASARRLFPTTGSILVKNDWVFQPEACTKHVRAVYDDAAMLAFVNNAIDLSSRLPVQQLVVQDPLRERTTLVTKFHHAAADGTSAALWLDHQLTVAAGIQKPIDQPSTCDRVTLRTSSTWVRRSKFAYAGPSDQLWSSNERRSGARGWTSISFDADALRRGCRKVRGFTYNDLLATCALEVFRRWNELHRAEDKQQIGLWLPVNIRRRCASFGNGTSRVRVYANYPLDTSFTEKCREVRRQIDWCMTNGEWVVPELTPINALPRWISAPVLRRYFVRPSIDMATGVFSHLGWNMNADAFEGLRSIECVGLLHPMQALAINGTTYKGRTSLTFTYNTGSLTATDVARITELYLEQLEQAKREFQ